MSISDSFRTSLFLEFFEFQLVLVRQSLQPFIFFTLATEKFLHFWRRRPDSTIAVAFENDNVTVRTIAG